MRVDRALFHRVLKTVSGFSNASPYVGIKLSEGRAYVHRSGDIGYIQTDGYSGIASLPIVVSLSHLITRLGVFQGAQVDLTVDQSGVLRLTSTDDAYGAEVRVFTIRQGITWSKTFDIGTSRHQVQPNLFQGVNLTGFQFAAQPIVTLKSLIFPTHFAVARVAKVLDRYETSPREDFIRILGTTEPTHIIITSKGYWKALMGGFELVIAGHTSGEAIAKQYDVEGPTLVTFPALHFLYALDAALGVSKEDVRIEFSATKGVQTRDSQGPASFALEGNCKTWQSFSITPKIGKLIAAALYQNSEELVQLSAISKTHLRLSRGAWSITFLAA